MKTLLSILLVCTLIGCSARKVTKTEVEVKQKTTSTEKDTLSILSEKNETLIDTSKIIEYEFEPIDSTKEMTIDGKKYHNVRFKTTSTKKGITTTKKEDSVLNELKITNNNTETNIKEDIKQSNKESFLKWWMWLILVAAIIFLYLDYKRR